MRRILFLWFCFAFIAVHAQTPQKLTSAEIHQSIQKLNFLGTALYLAAHPDDENTKLISYLSNEVHARTAYLSLTRGDGGQNLIGPEIREQLGLIRTQELLAARKIDGGEQFFTRANDFGYSKTPEETLEIWNKEEVLNDVVWIIRTFKPDIIINRFDHRTPGTTHGHHTSSAILGVEAFDLAGDKAAFPKQLQFTKIFKPQRLFFNSSWWFYGSEEAFEEANKNNLLTVDTGVYFPLKGMSNPEIASLSRSQHRSQGFGSTPTRGKQPEYLELIKGKMPKNENLFDGIDTSWSRLEDGKEIERILTKVEEEFDFEKPSESIPALVKAYQLIKDLKDEHWRKIKTTEIKKIIAACAGLYLEAIAENPIATPSEEIGVNLEVVNRSNIEFRLISVTLKPNSSNLQPNIRLKDNEVWKEKIILKIPQKTEYTSPYWLRNEGSLGMYHVEKQKLIGLPETPSMTKAIFRIEVNDIEIPFEKEIVYKYNDAVMGETYQPFEIMPQITVEIEEDVLIFDNAQTKEVSVKLTAGEDQLKGKLRIETEEDWIINPESVDFIIQQKGNSTTINFNVTPPQEQSETFFTPTAVVDGKEYSQEIVKINYSHIPLQTLVLPSKVKLTKFNIEKRGEKIGYIEGAGDMVPESLEQIGYSVTKINPETITEASLDTYDAVVVGIRAYNVVESLKYSQKALMAYVKNGGTLIVQYNTSRGLLIDNIAPFELQLSRDRVTEEDAEVRFLAKDHPVLNTPNKITKNDFEDWVQERGLYFADEWSDEFTPILSMNDKGETSKEGSLLIAEYGKGHYIYTGLSFFREFPAGVPGAFRLFANLISIGK